MFLFDAGGSVIDFGTIAFICQAEAIPAAKRLLLTGEFEPWRARRSTRDYPTSGDESGVTGRFSASDRTEIWENTNEHDLQPYRGPECGTTGRLERWALRHRDDAARTGPARTGEWGDYRRA